MPDGPGLELIAADLNDSHPGAVIETSYDREQAALIVDSRQVVQVLTWLRDRPEHAYTFLASVHGVDYLPGRPRFGVHYELLNMQRVERLRVKALLADPAAGLELAPLESGPLPEIDSVTPLFETANFQEREIYDFFGIVFRGHPNLKRILMPDGYVGWPQRRDFPVGGEPVIFTNTERQSPGWWK